MNEEELKRFWESMDELDAECDFWFGGHPEPVPLPLDLQEGFFYLPSVRDKSLEEKRKDFEKTYGYPPDPSVGIGPMSLELQRGVFKRLVVNTLEEKRRVFKEHYGYDADPSIR